jgi:hypothetical protein
VELGKLLEKVDGIHAKAAQERINDRGVDRDPHVGIS